MILEIALQRDELDEKKNAIQLKNGIKSNLSEDFKLKFLAVNSNIRKFNRIEEK